MDISKDEDESVRSNFRSILYLQTCRDGKLFSDRALYSPPLAGVVETRWRDVLEAILICALRQSLCHSAICRERLAIQKRTITNILHIEQVAPNMRMGVRFTIEGRCLKEFTPEDTTEGKTVSTLIGLTSGSSEALELTWEVLPNSGIFLSRMVISDPTAMLLL